MQAVTLGKLFQTAKSAEIQHSMCLLSCRAKLLPSKNQLGAQSARTASFHKSSNTPVCQTYTKGNAFHH